MKIFGVFMNKEKLRLGDNFSCMANGSVIWLTLDGYLLPYDVLSRKCFTKVVDRPKSKHMTFGLAYQASFHMKP